MGIWRFEACFLRQGGLNAAIWSFRCMGIWRFQACFLRQGGLNAAIWSFRCMGIWRFEACFLRQGGLNAAIWSFRCMGIWRFQACFLRQGGLNAAIWSFRCMDGIWRFEACFLRHGGLNAAIWSFRCMGIWRFEACFLRQGGLNAAIWSFRCMGIWRFQACFLRQGGLNAAIWSFRCMGFGVSKLAFFVMEAWTLPFGLSGAWGFGVSKLAFFFTFRIATLGGRRQGGGALWFTRVKARKGSGPKLFAKDQEYLCKFAKILMDKAWKHKPFRWFRLIGQMHTIRNTYLWLISMSALLCQLDQIFSEQTGLNDSRRQGWKAGIIRFQIFQWEIPSGKHTKSIKNYGKSPSLSSVNQLLYMCPGFFSKVLVITRTVSHYQRIPEATLQWRRVAESKHSWQPGRFTVRWSREALKPRCQALSSAVKVPGRQSSKKAMMLGLSSSELLPWFQNCGHVNL